MCKFAQFVCVLCVCVASANPAFAQIDGRENQNIGAIILPPVTDFMEGKDYKIRPATEKDKEYEIQTEFALGEDASVRVYQVSKNRSQKYLTAEEGLMLNSDADGVVSPFNGGMSVVVWRNGLFLLNVPANDTFQLSFRKAGRGAKVERSTLQGGSHVVFVPEGVLVIKHFVRNESLKELPELVIPPTPMPELKGPALPNLNGPVAGEEVPSPR